MGIDLKHRFRCSLILLIVANVALPPQAFAQEEESSETIVAQSSPTKKRSATTKTKSKAKPRGVKGQAKTQETRRKVPRQDPAPTSNPPQQPRYSSAGSDGSDSRDGVLLFEEIRRLYRAGKMEEVVEKGQRALELLRSKTRRGRIKIVQGLALYKLGHRYEALQKFLAAASDEPRREELRSSMTNAVAVARELQAENLLLSVFSKHTPDELSKEARDGFYYQIGKAHLRQENYDLAITNLSRVPVTSERYIDAKFLQGIAWNQKKDRAKAYIHFRDILTEGISSQEDQVVWELANLNAARVAFSQQNFIRAVEHYRRVPRSSAFWLDALFESSWPLLHLDQYNWALGNLKTLHSPYFMEKFYPESLILRAILLFRLCKYGEMRRTIKFYRKEYAAYQNLIAKYVREKEDKPNAFARDVLAYQSEEEGDPGDIPGRVWDWLVSDVQYWELQKRNDILKQEMARLRLSNLSPGIKATMEQNLKNAFGSIQAELNRFVRRKLVRAINQMRSLEDQLNILELEQTLGEKQTIESSSEPQAKAEVEVDISVESGFELWPFTGEYWKDELGFFAYSTGDSCQYE